MCSQVTDYYPVRSSAQVLRQPWSILTVAPRQQKPHPKDDESRSSTETAEGTSAHHAESQDLPNLLPNLGFELGAAVEIDPKLSEMSEVVHLSDLHVFHL